MITRRRVSFLAVLLFCLATGGCISVEQEIFLNPDGTGNVIVLITLPDLPDDTSKPEMGPKKSPAETMADFKRELTAALPPTIKLKESKEVKQNGVQSLYAVFEFKKVDDVQKILANFGKNSLKDGDLGTDPQWTISANKREGRTFFAQKFLLDVDKKPDAKTPTKGAPEEKEAAKAGTDFEEQLKPIFLSIVRMRFLLHAPTQITDSNADIVLNGNTAVWNCSLAAFVKNKKPIEMKATF